MSARSPITTHVLDTSRGRPAAGIAISLFRRNDRGNDDESWTLLGAGTTDADGRVADLLAPGSLQLGVHRIRFDTAAYFERVGVDDYFYPWAEIVFRIDAIDQHYHVPLLLNPFGYSTYRGS